MLEAARSCFATADQRAPDAEVRKKRGAPPTCVVFWVDVDNARWIRDHLGFAGCQMLVLHSNDRWRNGPRSCLPGDTLLRHQPLAKPSHAHATIEVHSGTLANREQPAFRQRSVVGRRSATGLRRPGLAERLASATQRGPFRPTATATYFHPNSPWRAKADETQRSTASSPQTHRSLEN